MKLNPMPAVALAALAVASMQTARAEVSSTVTLASEYDFRGITQTAGDPALQASLDFSTESGFYAGAWASNVDFGDGTDADVEIDGLVGFRGSFSEDLSYDVGGTYYYFMGDKDDVPFGELYAGLGYKAFSGKLWYSPDFSNFGESAYYVEGNLSFELPQDFALTVHAGWSDGDYWDATNGGGYMDYSVGISKSIGNFAVGLKFVDGGDLRAAKVTPGDVFTSKSKIMVTVATTLPW